LAYRPRIRERLVSFRIDWDLLENTILMEKPAVQYRRMRLDSRLIQTIRPQDFSTRISDIMPIIGAGS